MRTGHEKKIDYYSGGMVMPDRSFSYENYGFGFNGKLKDDEVKGSSNSYDYGLRIYDPRLVRFLSVDPLEHDYPWYTPYQFAGNSTIRNLDLDGAEPLDYLDAGDQKGFIRSSTKDEFDYSSISAGVKDASYLILSFVGLNLLDNYVTDLNDPNLSTSDATINFVSATISSSSRGPLKYSKGVGTKFGSVKPTEFDVTSTFEGTPRNITLKEGTQVKRAIEEGNPKSQPVGRFTARGKTADMIKSSQDAVEILALNGTSNIKPNKMVTLEVTKSTTGKLGFIKDSSMKNSFQIVIDYPENLKVIPNKTLDLK